jgi:hypothetical protein
MASCLRWALPAILFTISAAMATDPVPTDAAGCSKLIAERGHAALDAAANRKCVIAIAETYLDAMERKLPAEKMLVADDVNVHLLSTQGQRRAGNKSALAFEAAHAVVAERRDRVWAVEGNQATVIYRASLMTNPKPVEYDMAELITLEKGLVSDVIIAAPLGVQ